MDRRAKYDAEHTSQVALKLNLKTDADILAALASAPSKQGYIKALIRNDIREGKAMIDIALSNRDSIFDSARFATLEEALDFARGRGGKYVAQISREGHPGTSFAYDTDTDQFSRFDGWDWQPIAPEEIASYI